MEEIKFDLIEKVCEKQNFDELLLQIVKSNKENRINKILQNIEENKKLDKKVKRQIYEGIFDYVDDVNKYLKNNLKKIFSLAAKETIIQINSELKGGNVDMWRKIKVIIADDNVHFCKFIREYLEKYNDIEILGVANSDEDEIKMIEELKPEIVITDLMRNHRYTGLDIIKRYNDDNSKIKFLVISADYKKDVITDGLEVAGYIKKPFNDYKVIYDELKRIKKGINESEYKEWLEKYHNLEVRDINDYFTEEDKKIFEKLEIKLKDKIYTEFECESLYMDFLMYYDDPECDLSEEEKEFLLFEIENSMKQQLTENKDSYHKFKSMLPLIPSLIDSLDFGPGYRENYLGVRKGMKQVIEHKNLVLDGVKITYNNMNNDNMYTLVKQSNENVIFDKFFCDYIDKFYNNLTSDDPEYKYSVGQYFVKHMTKTREKILTLSKQYQK